MTTQDPSAPAPTNPPAPEPTEPPAPVEPPPNDPQAPESTPKPKPAEDPMARERRRADAEKRRADELQKQIDEAKRREAEEKGEWEKVAKQNETRAEAAEQKLQRVEAERRVERIANKPQFTLPASEDGGEGEPARFINPDEALALLPDGTDLTSEEAVTEALTELAASRPHLLRTEVTTPPPPPPPTPSGAPRPTGVQPGSPPKLTRDYIKTLSIPEIQKLRRERPDEFNAVMSGP